MTILERVVRDGGLMKGSRVMTYIGLWSICADELGRAPGMEEFVEWVGDPRRTVYRRQAEFREVFPEYETPQPLAEAVAAELPVVARQRSKTDVARMVPAVASVVLP